MTALFIMATVLWLVVMGYAAPAVWQMMTGKPVRRGDPMRLGVFMISTIVVAGSLRWLIDPGNMPVLAVVFALLNVTALYVIHLMRAYGRGGPV